MDILKLNDGAIFLNMSQLSCLKYDEEEKVGHIIMSDGSRYVWESKFETLRDFKLWASKITGQRIPS